VSYFDKYSNEYLKEAIFGAQGRVNIKMIANHYNITPKQAIDKCINFVKNTPLNDDWGNFGSIEDKK